MPPALAPLPAADVPAAGALLGRAFEQDPYFLWLAPEPARRARVCQLVYAWMLHELVDEGTLVAARDPVGALAGVVCLLAPGRRTRSHLARFLWRRRDRAPIALVGPGRMLRGVRTLQQMARARATLAESHWYLPVLGVSPEHQGTGVGAALMRHACALADADSRPLYLETTNPVNLPFYRRFGLADRAQFPTAGGPTMWTMLRATTRTEP